MTILSAPFRHDTVFLKEHSQNGGRELPTVILPFFRSTTSRQVDAKVWFRQCFRRWVWESRHYGERTYGGVLYNGPVLQVP